jgi:hypothetical protein
MYEICRSTVEYDDVRGPAQLAFQIGCDSSRGSVERRYGFIGE